MRNQTPEHLADTPTGTISFGGRILAAEHEYSPETYAPELAGAFNPFAQALMGYFDYASSDYPGAVMHVEPVPVDIKNDDTISFMVAWGGKTDFPHPRRHKVPEYFGALEVRWAKARRTGREEVTLDCQGLVGRMALRSGKVSLVTAFGRGEQNKGVATSRLVTAANQDIVVTDLISDLLLYRPLRLHAGVRWHGNNGYISNVFYPDDESGMLHRI